MNAEIVVLNCQKCNQCLKGLLSLILFFEGVLQLSLSLSLSLSLRFVIVFLLVKSCRLISLIKCLKGHKSPGSLFEGDL